MQRFIQYFRNLRRSSRRKKNGPRLLLVDDDLMFGKILSAEARRQNVSLTYWSDLLKKSTPSLSDFDIIILDYELENIDGFQFANSMADRLAGTPVMLVSSYGEFKKKSFPPSIVEFVNKEVGPQKIINRALELCLR